MAFPEGFAWGAATAAAQVEGAAFEDGRRPSIWDMMAGRTGRIWKSQSSAVACDHYHRYKQDVALMKRIGLKAYRLSVSWSRVIPEGTGAASAAGLDFYNRLIDELLAAGIQPWVTLYHWDYPLDLHFRGGWLNADAPRWFAEYARVVVEALGDRVSHWMTINEPQVFVMMGHRDGDHAPDERLSWPLVLRIAHHVLVSHGRAAQAIRAAAKLAPQVGWASALGPPIPATDSPADLEAARTAFRTMKGKTLWETPWWLEPMCHGRYPADGLDLFGPEMPPIPDADMRTIAQPLDFVGLNIYSGRRVRAAADGRPEQVPLPTGHPITHFDWPVLPEALYWGPRHVHEQYGLPVVITENGLANPDWVSLDGAVHDPQRIDYTRRYLAQLSRAIADGVDVRGYFHWSLLDNFEWAHGYRYRFGLVHVDFETQQRTPKDSAAWYANVIATNGKSLLPPQRGGGM